MLKYENEIGRLSESTKIDLLTNLELLSERELIAMGLPEIKIGVLEQIMKNIYPSSACMTNSWNTELVGEVAAAAGARLAADGIGLAITPAAKIKINPYRTALSEDACLCASIAGAYAEGVRRAGIVPCMSGFCIEPDEVSWMDENPDASVIYEYVVAPYLDSLGQGGTCVFVREDLHTKNYENQNHLLASLVSDKEFGTESLAVCGHVSAENTVKFINDGIICLQGAGYALQAALRKYVNVKKSVDRGDMKEDELAEEIARGTAISPEMLDAAVDRVIDFIYSCSRKYGVEQKSSETVEGLALNAARESAVLLKNENRRLPLTRKLKIAVIGDIFTSDVTQAKTLSDALESEGMSVIGTCRGYDLRKDVPDAELSKEAHELAAKADVVLLFVGVDEKREKYVTGTKNLSLPANQDVLACELSKKHARKTVALLSGNYATDVDSLTAFDAIMLAPVGTKATALAIADILTGKYSPSGRLSSSMHRRADSVFAAHQQYLRTGMKVGRFMGYRYFDSAGVDVEFPFGHGLGYSKFTYSGLHVAKDGKLTFTLKNSGRVASHEVVQIYAGLDGGAEPRAAKELVAFEKVFLEAGESKRIEITPELPKVFDTEPKAFVLRRGRYNLYVGSSIRDIRLQTTLEAGDREIPDQQCPRAQYIQTESNIISDNYTLEAKYPIMKKAIKNIFAGVAFIILAICLQIYCVSAGTSSWFLNILTLAATVAAVVFFVIDAIDRKRMGDIEKIEAEKANEKWFEDATKLESFDTDKMFADEFGEKVADGEGDEHADQTPGATADDYYAYIDKDFSFEMAARELEQFAAERGCRIDQSSVYGLLSAVASSRLILISGLNKDEFIKLASVVCEYFECTTHIDTVDSTYKTADRIFYATDSGGNRSKTGTLRVIEEAAKDEADLHVAAIAGVGRAAMENCFADIVKYAKNPYANQVISSIPEKYRFPQNLCFMAGLGTGVTVADIPAEIAAAATVMEIKVTLGSATGKISSIHKLKYHQLDYMSERAHSRSDVDEGVWKNIDRLEALVRSKIQYSITNKKWLGIERYVSVFVACNGELSDAVDRAVASKLIPEIVSLLSADTESISELGGEMENIFGENNAEVCRKTVRQANINKTTKKS